jgi:hypothetical protein
MSEMAVLMEVECDAQGHRQRFQALMKKYFRTPRKGGLAKHLYTKLDWLSAAEWLGLSLKGLICTIDK